MPNIKSAKKRVIVAEKKNLRNKSYRSALKTEIKKGRRRAHQQIRRYGRQRKGRYQKDRPGRFQGDSAQEQRRAEEVRFGCKAEQGQGFISFFETVLLAFPFAVHALPACLCYK